MQQNWDWGSHIALAFVLLFVKMFVGVISNCMDSKCHKQGPH